MKTIMLDNTCDPDGAARRIYAKWHHAQVNYLTIDTQEIVERAWLHYHNKLRKQTAPATSTVAKEMFGIIKFTYDDTTPQLKGSTPQKLITALQIWENTGDAW